MPLGTEVGLGPDDIVLYGDPALPTERGTASPLFGSCLLWSNVRRSQQLLSSCKLLMLPAELTTCIAANFQHAAVQTRKYVSLLFSRES